ncbi:hypothetical protein ASPZODRAFT_2122686 [Penicilliopsis zonata CBS 506.65]|uniref:FAD/NAD(P)-binding domain-containing protein n=1 Tax=Penicilliopsis zonata CBS 506.65 TaxID=1073090 RepID=A0A1L9S4V3_9EURO|nr:hypothetical protein ASPZODRAFT_2122686 [Penicilliopsis zonata CBS 506.65]OJJ42184.1 hypothetical protein ASPZODRAFT_2122686 [Penicilliopsis zonata CBS 506.65]
MLFNEVAPEALEGPLTVSPARWAFQPRQLRIVCIGAGFSGLTLAYKLQHENPLSFVDWVVYEKNRDVGGTWFENIYPGVGCDVPAHSYVFPFAPNPEWSQCYAKGDEIEQYILDTADRFGLKERVVLNTRLEKSVWNEETGKWALQLRRDDVVIHDEADVLINAGGILNRWQMPDIPGLGDFKGRVIHTAAWDKTYDWTDKRVAVIGNGSSGLQVVPALQPRAAKLVNFIRQPTWVSMSLCPDVTRDGKGTNFAYTEEEKKTFREDPAAFLKYRKRVENSDRVNTVYRLMLTGSELNGMLSAAVDDLMRSKLAGNPELIDRLIPQTEVGCRRLSPGDGYLEALQESNAGWCFDKIECITPTGIRTSDGAEHEFDLIVCATGFETSFVPGWEMMGRDGRTPAKDWAETPQAYFSLCAGGMPNYFVFAGPNCPIGHGSVPQMLGWSVDYALKWVEKMAKEDIKSVCVKDTAVQQYNRHAQATLNNTVWSTGCAAWYNNGKAVTAMYPGSVLHFKESISNIRGEDFDIKYATSDPFGYLGNGELQWERDEGVDLGFYLK